MPYDTINKLPSAGPDFLTDLQAFLRSEVADYLFRNFGDTVLEGGYGGTSNNLTHTISEVKAFVSGHWVNNAQVSHTYAASKRTWVFLRADDSATVNFGTGDVTYDGHFVFCEVASGTVLVKTPAGTVPLLEVDTDATTITAVTDLRKCRAPLKYYGDLETAISTIGSTMEATLHITERTAVSVDTTVPANIVLDFTAGRGMLAPNFGITVTIYSPQNIVVAHHRQIFGGAGAISFTEGGVVYPDWWKENTTPGTTDMYDALSAADTAIGGSGTIEFFPYEYAVGTNITFGSTINLSFPAPGSLLSPGVGVTVTIYSADNVIAAPTQTVFGGAGSIAYTAASESVSDKVDNFFATGRTLLLYEDTAPTGWTIQDTLDDKLVFVTKGSAAGGETGGTVHSSGTWTRSFDAHDHVIKIGIYGANSNLCIDSANPPPNDGGLYPVDFYAGYTAFAANVPYIKTQTTTPTAPDTWRPAAYCCIMVAKD
jgi:hypothetical protein